MISIDVSFMNLFFVSFKTAKHALSYKNKFVLNLLFKKKMYHY